MTRPSRYGFLDLYRGIIVLIMIEGHVVRAVLEPDARTTQLFTLHELFHGITAPGFLFGAGFAFAIATQRRWEQLLSLTPTLLRRLWRPLLLVLIGYALHLPFFSLRKTLAESSPEQWMALLSFDVLQCIGLVLLGLRLLFLTLRSERAFIQAVSVLLILVVYATPLVWGPSFDRLFPNWIASALNGLHGSDFPLFPNAGFLLAGTVASWKFLLHAQEGNEPLFMRRLALLGAALVVGGIGLAQLPLDVNNPQLFWTISPNFFWIRLGSLFLFVALLWYFESSVEHGDKADFWMPKWLILLGIESLFVYIVHLVVIYGWLLFPGSAITDLWGLSLSTWRSVLVFVLLTAALYLMTWAWHHLKRNHPVVMQCLYWWLGGNFLYYFVTNPW